MVAVGRRRSSSAALGRPEVDLPGLSGTPSQTSPCAEAGYAITRRSSQGFHIVIHRCPLRVENALPGRVSSEPGNSREQSCARGTAQWRGLRGAGSTAGPGAAAAGPTAGPAPVKPAVRVVSPGRGKRASAPSRRSADTAAPLQPHAHHRPPGDTRRFGHRSGRNKGFRGHPGVAGRLRRVVVARRCTQHHLRRVMVETPPRAGPSPPPRTGPFFSARAGGACERYARNEEFTGAPSCVVAWRRLFEGIDQAGRRPNHGCRISADGTEPSAREALCTSPTVRSRHGRRGGGPVPGPRQCRAAPGTCLTTTVRRPPDRSARSRPPGPASTPSLPDLFRGGTSFRGDQHKAPQAR